MKFKCIGTGSSGNCYLIELGGSYILLDAGVTIEKITKAINLNLVDFAFISHEHKDHSLSEENLRYRAVSILEGRIIHRFEKITKFSQNKAKLDLYCFPVEHGDCPTSGIIIHKSGNVKGEEPETILYVTDFNNCVYDLSDFKFTSVIVECNYIKDKTINADNFTRTKENIYRHLSLEGCDMFLSKLDLSNCKEIILTHFSENFSDPIFMGSYINNKYKIKTLCCRKFGGYDIYE